jgi:hypothetical protein
VWIGATRSGWITGRDVESTQTTVNVTIDQEFSAASLLADSLMSQIQNLEAGPTGDELTPWTRLLAKKQVQFNVVCEILQDLRAMKDVEQRFEAEDLADEFALDHEAPEWVEPPSELEDRACRGGRDLTDGYYD